MPCPRQPEQALAQSRSLHEAVGGSTVDSLALGKRPPLRQRGAGQQQGRSAAFNSAPIAQLAAAAAAAFLHRGAHGPACRSELGALAQQARAAVLSHVLDCAQLAEQSRVYLPDLAGRLGSVQRLEVDGFESRCEERGAPPLAREARRGAAP